jgi:outer membrane protein assembly factor BamB
MLPALLAVILLAAGLRTARGQELAMPAVDDSPSSQLLLEQAADQARANPREAVRLLVQALDAGPGLVVRSPRDPDLFVTVGARVHSMLAADPALRAAYRKEVGPDADAQLARGELDALVRRRLDTEAGLRAAMLLAERALARGHFSQALACLERTADHDLLAPPRRERHAALLAEVRTRVAAPAVSGLGPGFFDRSFASARWGETWDARLPLPGAVLPVPGASALPAVLGDRVFVDDGRSVRALERLSGRTAWETVVASDPGSGMRAVSVDRDGLMAFGMGAAVGARPANGALALLDPSDGTVRWDTGIDRLASDRSLEGAVPEGASVIAEGRALVALRKTSARFESVSMLASVDLERPRDGSWVRILATSGSLRLGFARGGESPVLAGGVAYLATATGAVAAVDPWDGALRWLRRFPVPVRDRVPSEEASAVSTPAVVGGRVWAVTPDRTRIIALDAADGTVAAEIAVSSESGFGGPSYMLGDDAAGLVVAVGDRLTGIRAAEPGRVAWSVPVDGEAGPKGRVSVARTADAAAPVLVVPEEGRVRVVEMRDGADVLALEGIGACNPVLAGAQLLAATPAKVSSWMPVAEAERTARAAMAASGSPESAMALLSLARQFRSAELARDGAEESVRRARSLEPGDPLSAGLLQLLLAVDALDLPGADAVERAVDEAATLAGMPERAGFARAERALRRGRPRDAARFAVEAAFAAAPGADVPSADGWRSVDAAARDVIARAAAMDRDASLGASDAADAAVSAAAPGARAAALRRAARLAAGTPAGDRALAACAAALADASPRALAQLADECAALGAGLREELLRDLGEWRGALAPRPLPPSVDGEFARAVEFRGRLPRRMADAGHVRGGVLTVLDGELAFRPAPAFTVAWRAPVPSPEVTLVSAEPDIIVCDDGPQGSGTLVCITPDGSVRWLAAPPAPDDGIDADERDAANDPALALDSVSRCIALPTAPAIAVLDRDGRLRAHDRATGAVRWTRDAAGNQPLVVAASPLAIVLVERGPADSDADLRVVALDPADGAPVAAWDLAGTDELHWVRIVPGGLVVIATGTGIEARRLAGGDEDAPYWRLDQLDAREPGMGWALPGRVAYVDRGRALASADAWSGTLRPAVDEDSDATVATMVSGKGWFAALSRDSAIFLDAAGALRGRSAPGGDRTFVAAAAALGRLFVVDHAVGKAEAEEIRSTVLLRDLDPSAGGFERSPPLVLRTVLRRITDISVHDGGVAVGNGSTVQALVFSKGAGADSR